MKKNERRKRKSEEKERRRREKKQWLQWRIQGRDPPAPLIFRPNLGPKGQKKITIRSIILSLSSLLESVYEII